MRPEPVTPDFPGQGALRFLRAAGAAPKEPGAYVLLIRLGAPLDVRAGSRGARLPAGRYLYCGSARGPGGLAARLARHMRRGKRPHWHIDAMTEAGIVEGAWIEEGGDECALNARLAAFPVPVEGFGATDCRRCRAHLRFWTPDAPRRFHDPEGAC